MSSDSKGNEDGLRLAAYRHQHQLTQGDIADILWPGKAAKRASNIRKVSYVESGERRLGPDEVRLLEKHLTGFKELKVADAREVMSSAPRTANYSLDPDTFLRKQQQYLDEIPGPGDYDLWLFNGQVQPAGESEAYRESWVNNLSEGSCYFVFWELVRGSEAEWWDFKNFMAKLAAIMDRRSAPIGRISVFPFVVAFKSWTPEIDRLFRKLMISLAMIDEAARVKLYAPFAAFWDGAPQENMLIRRASVECVNLLLQNYQAAASTVVYLPKAAIDKSVDENLGRPEFAATEPPGVIQGFDPASRQENQHLLYNPRLIGPMVSSVVAFHKWVESGELPLLVPSTNSGDAT